MRLIRKLSQYLSGDILFEIFLFLLAMTIALLAITLSHPAQAAPEPPPDFYTWVVQGTRYFAGDYKDVPQAYRDSAQALHWKQLVQATRSHWTVSESHVPSSRVTQLEEAAKPEVKECGAPYHSERIWKQYGDYTRLYTVILDSCGQEKGIGLDNMNMSVNLKP